RAPDHPAALLLRGQLELAADRPADALAWLRRAEAASPHETDTLSALIDALRRLGRADEAAAYEARLAELKQRLDRLDDLTRRVSARQGDPAELRLEGARLLLQLGRAGQAAEWLLTTLREAPGHGPTLLALAEVYEA